MKWPKIIIASAAVIMLFSGISTAGYEYLCPHVFKIEFFKNITLFFIDIYRSDTRYIIEGKAPEPESAKIEEMARLQRIVNSSI